MKKKIINQSRGFMQIVLLAIIIIATLAYFNIDLRTILNRPEIQKVWHIFVVAWDTFIKPLFTYLWTSIGDLASSGTATSTPVILK